MAVRCSLHSAPAITVSRVTQIPESVHIAREGLPVYRVNLPCVREVLQILDHTIKAALVEPAFSGAVPEALKFTHCTAEVIAFMAVNPVPRRGTT